MQTQYTSIDRIFSKVNRDITSDFNEEDVIEWTGEALGFMESNKSFDEAVAFMEVNNFTANMPPLSHGLIQIARNNKFTPETKNLFCPKAITDTIVIGEKPNTAPIPLNCAGMPMMDYDLAYYRPYFDLQFEYYGWT